MRALSTLLLAMALVGPARAAEPAATECVGPDGRHPIVEAGREADVRALFAPHEAGEPLEGAPGWTFRSIDVAQRTITARLEGPAGAQARLVLAWAVCGPPGAERTGSFTLAIAGDPGGEAAARRLAEAVGRHDDGRFWRVFVGAPTAAAAAGASERQHAVSAPEPPWQPPWANAPVNEIAFGLALVLMLALLALLVDLPTTLGELNNGRRGALWIALGVLALTALAWALRLAAEPTYVREAYPLPAVVWLTQGPFFAGDLRVYPLGPEISAWAVGRWLAADPFEAWFGTNALYGALSVPLAWMAGTALTRSRRAGVIAAALLALWPQHIRITASEATHAGLVFWLLAAVAFTLVAAANGRLRSYLAATLAAGAALTMRPEAAVAMPGLVALALLHRDGIRRRLLRPERLAALAGLAWLLWPQIKLILGDQSVEHFEPGSDTGEGVGLVTLWRLGRLMVWPDGNNAFFDPATAPLWLWPLALWGGWRLWHDGRRGAAIGLGLMALGFFALYSGQPPAVTIWGMGRYHMSALPFVALLSAVGLWHVVARWRHPVVAGVGVAALGAALWWPAVAALPMDWQQDHAFAVDLGREHPELTEPGVRLIYPDNRRRWRDLSPRIHHIGLTRGLETPEASVPIAAAIARLHVGDDRTPAYYYEGLFCWLAVAPGEPFNPQCQAMHDTFELEPVAAREVADRRYLTAYEASQAPGPYRLALYRVGARRLSPEEGARRLPEPIDEWLKEGAEVPYGSATAQHMQPPVPPLP